MGLLTRAGLGLLGQILSVLNGGIASSLRLITNLLTGGFKMAFQFNETAMAFSRQAGLTAKQAQAYTEVLATRAKDLGDKYGIAAEEVAKLEKNLARASGRVLMLSSAEAERQIQINRTVGEETSNQFTQTIMRTMGGQLSTVQGAVSKAYATAAKKGLDAAGMAAKVGQNLTMANRLTFKNGIDGLTKMVALSEKMGFNMQSLESAANKFMDIQDAIENSAKLSMLGGAAGAFGGNPLDMSYEANYDPEAFGERMTKMLGGYAQFDAKTGMARMNAMSRDFVKGIADAMGISLDEATAIAKKNAEITYKNNKFGQDLDRLSGGDANKRDFLLNKTQIIDGKMKLKDKNGEYRDMSYFQNDKEGRKQFEDMMKYNNMSDEEIMAEQAQTLKSIYDTLQGYVTSIFGRIAEKITPHMDDIKNFLGDIYKMVLPHVGKIAENIKSLIQTALKPENIEGIKSGIEAIINFIGKISNFVTSGWIPLIGAIVVTPILSAIAGLAGAMMLGGLRGGGIPGGTSRAAGGAAKSFFSSLKNAGKSFAGWVSKGATALKKGVTSGARGAYKWLTKGKHANTLTKAWGHAKGTYKNTVGGATRKLAHGARALWNNSKLVRGLGRGGAVGAAIMGTIEGGMSLFNYNKKKDAIEKDKAKSQEQKNKELELAAKERNRNLSGAGGGVLGGIAGGAAGGLLGGMAGGALAGTAVGTAVPGLGNAVGLIVGGIVGGIGYYLGKKGGEKAADVIQGAPEHHWGGAKSGAVGKVTTPEGDDILTWLKRGEIVFNGENQKFLADYIRALPVGGKEHIHETHSSSNKSADLKVNDFNVNVTGTIKLDGGNNSQNIDVRSLLNDVSFVSALKDIIKDSIASDINGGRIMNDTARMAGYESQSRTVGRLT